MTRTCDPLVPNQMRYQLRHTPKKNKTPDPFGIQGANVRIKLQIKPQTRIEVEHEGFVCAQRLGLVAVEVVTDCRV